MMAGTRGNNNTNVMIMIQRTVYNIISHIAAYILEEYYQADLYATFEN